MPVERQADLAIVGAGILGLAHAWHAVRRGLRVVVFERSPVARGASIRNFGMIWPVGQPPGALHDMARRSRAIWLEVIRTAGLFHAPTGALFATYRRDERDVAVEFAEFAPRHGYECVWLPSVVVRDHYPAVRGNGLLGALWSPGEITVDPREAVSRLTLWLSENGVIFRFGTTVHEVVPERLRAGVESWSVGRVVVCSGSDIETLFPHVFQDSGVTRCKLQMMRTGPQPVGWSLGPSMASALTFRFYPSFGVCTTLPRLAQRIREETPELDRWGIHTLVSETADGQLTLGDSHEYGLSVSPFDRAETDALILRHIATFLNAPDMVPAERWHGTYAKHPVKPYILETPEPGVHVAGAVGGSGMTLSFGLAEHHLKEVGL